jgi:methyltransferase (TIGR00027 family)
MSTSHQDTSRKEVGSTAHAVAYMRGLESQKEDALVFDPYAIALGTEIGEATTNSFVNNVESADKSFNLDGWVSGIGVRSRKIDDSVVDAIQRGIRQVVVLGAGLDTRPWRLNSIKGIDQTMLSEVRWYEVDFQELFDFKSRVLKTYEAIPAVDYREVVADLSVDDWDLKLLEQGYLPDRPTFWLLEGLTGYLTKEECLKLLTGLYQRSSSSSCMLATFVPPKRRLVNPLHRFHPENPLEFVKNIGWKGDQVDLNDLSVEYGRTASPIWEGYMIATVYKP